MHASCQFVTDKSYEKCLKREKTANFGISAISAPVSLGTVWLLTESYILHTNTSPDTFVKMFTHIVLLVPVLFIFIFSASGYINIEELTNVQYKIDILDRPLLLDEVSDY
jgi:hypothetical protein